MKTSENKINGIVFHKVIPASDEEAKFAEEFLKKDADGTFSDMGDDKCWKKFIKASAIKREAELNKIIYDLFNSSLKGN